VASLLLSMGPSIVYAQADPRIEAAELAVKQGLRDPGSTQFKNVAVKTNSLGEIAVCGEFNARNSFGGYVGFQSFGVVDNAAVTQNDVITQAKLARMGCFGLDAELAIRHSDAQIELARKLHDQADFSCNVIWTMMDNRFRQQQGANAVLDAAIVALKNRAQENNSELSPETSQTIRSQFETQLAKTAGDKKTVEKIRNGDVAFKDMFVQSCVLQTDQMLRVRAGLE
jgi:hypothetical protein